eukprot:scaffold50322_cov62-Phaeocystis_antarctica.AAC.5
MDARKGWVHVMDAVLLCSAAPRPRSLPRPRPLPRPHLDITLCLDPRPESRTVNSVTLETHALSQPQP